MPTASPAIPVEALLKLTLDRTGADTIQQFLDGQEKSWGRIEQTIGRMSDGLEGVARMGLGLAGIAGIGAMVSNYMQTAGAGSGVAMAAGHVTGGMGAWQPYTQSLYGAQAKTGVASGEIAQGLIAAIQQVGGNPSPQQAEVLGGLLAGFGQTAGLTPAQVSSIVAPLLMAANKPFTQGNLMAALNATSGNLSAFPGSQQAAVLGALSQLGFAQAIGAGPHQGFTPNMHGLAAVFNAAAQTDRIWRSPSLTGGAINAVSGGLQNAYTNPPLEAFMNMAGISYQQQRRGFTESNMQDILHEADRLYGTGNERDIFLRSMFGLQGADLLEQFTPGGRGASNLSRDMQHHVARGHLRSLIAHNQARTTPGATATRVGGGIMGWLTSSLPHAALGLGGAVGLLKSGLLKRGLGGLGRGIDSFLGGGEEGLGLDTIAGDVLGGGTALGLGAGALATLPLDAMVAGMLNTQPEAKALAHDKHYGGWRTMAGGTIGGSSTHQTADTLDKFKRGSESLLQASELLKRLLGGRLGPNFSSYTPGMGTSAIQGIGSMAPGMEFASLSLGSSGSGSPGSSMLASYGLGSGAGSQAPSGSGWQKCTLTWYDPALGGTNSSNGQANPHSRTSSGQPYNASSLTCAAPSQYAFGTVITFSYQGNQVTCTVNDRGGAITGSHFDLSRGAAQQLGMLAAGVVQGHFQVVSQGSSKSGSGSGSGSGASSSGSPTGASGSVVQASTASPSAGGAIPAVYHPSTGQVHVHVHVDGQQIRARRLITGRQI